jgi:hypothetical protein
MILAGAPVSGPTPPEGKSWSPGEMSALINALLPAAACPTTPISSVTDGCSVDGR